MKQAVFVKNIEGWTGNVKMYKMLPPLVVTDYDDKSVETHEFVIVSSTVSMFGGPETCIFPATEDGETKSLHELEGSYHGGLDHAEALRGAGYEVVHSAMP